MHSIHILFRSFSLFFLQKRRSSSRRRRYQSRFGARAPHALPSLSLSLTSQHEIYSLKSLNYILVTNFFMPLVRETKDSAEYYEAVLSLKSTGLTYRTKRFIVFFALCARETLSKTHSRKSRALRTRELFHILLDFLLLLLCVILSEPQREMIPLRVVVFRGCIHMCLHVFDFLFFFFERFFFFSSSSQKKRFFLRARETLFIYQK